MTHWINTHFWADLAIGFLIAFVLVQAWMMLFVYCLSTALISANRKT